jgi:hypothetical protein
MSWSRRMVSNWSFLHRIPNCSDHSYVCLEAWKNMKYGHVKNTSAGNDILAPIVELSPRSTRATVIVTVQMIDRARIAKAQASPEVAWARSRFNLNLV